MTLRPWIEPQDFDISNDLLAATDGDPLLAKALMQRGLLGRGEARAFLDPSVYAPSDPYDLPDMERAVAQILNAIAMRQPILVWGDFDVDGQTATAVLVASLHQLGAQVSYHIPVRASESHGVHPLILEKFLQKEAIGLVLTCDTGVSAHEGVDLATRYSVPVVITDHHELPQTLPDAAAVVTPRRLPASHPMSSLPGVGVALKLVEALCDQAGQPDAAAGMYDLAALGCIADVATLTGEARYQTQLGLELLRHPQRPGLLALYEFAELDPTYLTEEHVGFTIAPRLNALGRLSDANPAVELLTTSDFGVARQIAARLEGLNSQRRLLTSQVLRAAAAQLQSNRNLFDEPLIFLHHPSWEAGVIGIVAGQLAERYGRPVILAVTPANGLGRASARSSRNVDITAALRLVDELHPGLLHAFGGHRAAAGFSFDSNHLAEIQRLLSQAVRQQAEQGKTTPTPIEALTIDAYLDWDELSINTAIQIERLAPFGVGNPPLLLASKELRLINNERIGREGEHLVLTIASASGLARRVIWWGGGDFAIGTLPSAETTFDLAYILRASTYRGQRELSLEWVDYRPVSAAEIILTAPPITGLDFRRREHPLPALERLLASEPNCLVWVEGEAFEHLAQRLPAGVLVDRQRLAPCRLLVIWSSPPSQSVLQAALQVTRPEKVAIFGVDPQFVFPQDYLSRLAGLVKYALTHQPEKLDLEQIAAASAQTITTVQAGLDWLFASGRVDHQWIDKTGAGARKPSAGEAENALQRLTACLEESRAYRRYFARAAIDLLLNPSVDVHP